MNRTVQTSVQETVQRVAGQARGQARGAKMTGFEQSSERLPEQ